MLRSGGAADSTSQPNVSIWRRLIWKRKQMLHIIAELSRSLALWLAGCLMRMLIAVCGSRNLARGAL